MSKTKACNLTEDEISAAINYHGNFLAGCNFDDSNIERINYLNKRLKTFNDVEIKTEEKPNLNEPTTPNKW